MVLLTNVDGEMGEGTRDEFPALLADLARSDDEHPDVSVQGDEGLCLSLYGNGRVVLEDVEGDALVPHWCRPADDEERLRLMGLLADGDLAGLLAAAPWVDGYGDSGEPARERSMALGPLPKISVVAIDDEA